MIGQIQLRPLFIVFEIVLLLLLYRPCMIHGSPLTASASTSAPTSAPTSTSTANKCERLKTSLTYSQENAPQDISAVLPLIVERVNRELSRVVDVEVLFTGSEIHRRVGKHTVQCLVTRLLQSVDADSGDAGKTDTESEHDNDNDDDNDDDSFKYQTRGVDEDGRDVVTQCFLVPFTILDVDECDLPLGHSMRHGCAEPSVCVNTLGSYECLCPLSFSSSDERDVSSDTTMSTVNIELASSEEEEIVTQFWNQIVKSETTIRTPWEKSLPSSKKSSCPSRASTHGCCDVDGHSRDGSTCRSQFRCPIDPCMKDAWGDGGRSRKKKINNSGNSNNRGHDCVSTAICTRAVTPLDVPSYTCECPPGFMGSGRTCRPGIDVIPPRPKVKFDGLTPTDETVQNNYYCGCTKPVIDPCAGYDCTGKNKVCAVKDDDDNGVGEPHCVCKTGYVHVDTFGCVDESPPTLKLRHDEDNDGMTYLKQGDKYKEYAVDVIDENAEDYKRSLKIAYSRPLPEGCETKIGSFQVNYTVAMPWTNPPYARVTRTVVIQDIDECSIDTEKYETQCPQIIPFCDIDHGAICVNTVGSYTCKCPNYTKGDGFMKRFLKTDSTGNFIDAPEGFNGGTGCVDTSKPVIKVLGPNPKVLRTPKCAGLSGIMGITKKKKDNEIDKKLVSIQREGYEDDIRNAILVSNGAELCATSTRTNPRPIDCVQATDYTYLGNIDLSSRVTVGNPVQVSPLAWKVPYNVMDDAGNAASTVWRQIVVEEVDLFEIGDKFRIDALADKDVEVKEAVRLALEEERRKQRKKDEIRLSENNTSATQKSCPACPICTNKNKGNSFTAAQCLEQCEKNRDKMNLTCEDTIQSKQTSQTVQIVLDSMMSIHDAFTTTFIVAAVVILVISVQFVRMISSFLSRRGGWYYLTEDDGREEQEILNRVTYFSPEGRPRNGNAYTPSMANANSPVPSIHHASGPPRVSMAFSAGPRTNVGTGNGIFSSPENRHGIDGGTFTPENGGGAHSTPGSTTPYNLRRNY